MWTRTSTVKSNLTSPFVPPCDLDLDDNCVLDLDKVGQPLPDLLRRRPLMSFILGEYALIPLTLQILYLFAFNFLIFIFPFLSLSSSFSFLSIFPLFSCSTMSHVSLCICRDVPIRSQNWSKQRKN